MEATLVAIGVFGIVATLIPRVSSEAWWIRAFGFPRLQIAVVIAATLVGMAIWWEWSRWAGAGLGAMLLVCLGYQLYMIYPYTALSRKQVQESRRGEPGRSVRLLSANVLMSNREAERLKAIVRAEEPDLVLLLEPNGWWEEQMRELERSYPHVVRKPLENTYGMLLYSRLELIDPQVRFLVEEEIPSIHALVRLPCGLDVELHCLHPRPPYPTEDIRVLDRDAELLVVGREVSQRKDPIIVIGDLNDVAWSRTTYLFQDASGLLDPRIGRGLYNTFHAKYPLVRFPLDHCFHSTHFRLVGFRVLPYFGSDHFPICIELNYEADAVREQDALNVTDAEQAKVRKRIERAQDEYGPIKTPRAKPEYPPKRTKSTDSR